MAATLENDLAKIIGEVRENIDKQPDYDKFNEARTREAIVAPILRTIGWHVADFSLVDVEYYVHQGQGQRAVDYALWNKSRPRVRREDRPAVLVEAKGVNVDINGNDKESIIVAIRHYAFEAGVPYVVLTNGKLWRVHHFESPVILPFADYQKGSEVDISSGEANNCARALMDMFKSLPLGLAGGATASISSLEPGWVHCERLDSGKSNRSLSIRFPNGVRHDTRYWYELLVRTAEWLWEEGELSAENVPIATKEDGSRYIINTIPVHKNGHEFTSPKRVNESLVIEGHVGSHAVEQVNALLEHCGLNPADTYLRAR